MYTKLFIVLSEMSFDRYENLLRLKFELKFQSNEHCKKSTDDGFSYADTN